MLQSLFITKPTVAPEVLLEVPVIVRPVESIVPVKNESRNEPIFSRAPVKLPAASIVAGAAGSNLPD
jgi:hypothetical protein